MPALVYVADRAGQIVYVNARALRFTGSTLDELRGAGWFLAIHPEDRPGVSRAWTQAVATGEPFEAEYRLVAADGTCAWFLCRAAAFRRDGKADHWVANCVEIEDRKCAETLLAESEAWYRSTFEHAAVGVAHVALDGRVLAANDRLCALLGRPRAAMLQATFRDLAHPGDLQADEKLLARLLAGEIDHYTLEQRYVRADGAVFWGYLTVGLERDAEGKPRHLVAFVEDITAHKARYTRLEQTLHALDAISWEWDPLTDEVSYFGDTHNILGTHIGSSADFFAAVDPLDRDMMRAAVRRAADEGAAYDLKFRLVRADGGERWVRDSARPIMVDGRRLVSGILRDITDEIRAQRRLTESEERLRLAFAASQTNAWDWDFTSGRIAWTEALSEKVGLGKHGFGGTPDAFWNLVHEDDKPLVKAALDRAIAGDEDYAVEYRMRRPDGSIRWTSTRAITFRDESGKPVRLVGVDTDITDQRLAEAELRERDLFLNSVLDSSVDCIKVVERDGTLSYMNSNGMVAMEIDDFGLVDGQMWCSLWPAEHQKEIRRALDEALAGRPSRFEAPCPTAKGKPRWWHLSVAPILDDQGNVLRVVSISRDITESRQQQREILELAERAELAQVATRSFVYEYGPDLEPVYHSPTMEHVVGYSPADMTRLAATGQSFVHPEDRDRFEEQISRALITGTDYNLLYRVVHKDGSIIHGFDAGRIFRDEAGRPQRIVGTFTNITSRALAETALEASEARLRAITEALPQMIWSARPDGQHDYFNARWYEYTGVAPGTTDGDGWKNLFHPDDHARIDRLWGHSLATGDLYEIEYRLRTADGQYRWVLGRALPMRGENGEIVRWMGSCTDIDQLVETRRALAESRQELEEAKSTLEAHVLARTAELRGANRKLRDEIAQREAAQAALLQSQKLEAIGQLTSGVAHDFNNVLAAIAGGVRLIQRRTQDPAILEIASQSGKAAERGTAIVRQLLSFARQQTLESARVSLGVLRDEVEQLVRHSLGPGIQLAVDIPDDIPAVWADKSQLETALINLCVNARDAMNGAGELVISARHCPPEEAGRPTELEHTDAVAVSVRDDGPGMAPEVLQRVLEPFYTTKGPGKGTGLGLAMVHGFTRQSRGSLRIESKVGQGTTITLFLPVAAADEQKVAPAATAPDVHPADGARILLVDDDEGVRKITAAHLRDYGYAVTEARNGPDALRLIAGETLFDAVLSDVIMPGISGPALAEEMRRDHADLPILFMTGHADRELLRGETIVAKPFRPEDLARTLAHVLKADTRGAAAGEAEYLRNLHNRLHAPGLKQALARWSDAKGILPLPAFAEFDLAACPDPHKVSIAHVDLEQVPAAFRFAHVGADLQQQVGAPSGGGEVAVRGIDDPDTQEAAYRRCARSKRPTYERLRIGSGQGKAPEFERLLLPWSARGDNVDRIVEIVVFGPDPADNAAAPAA